MPRASIYPTGPYEEMFFVQDKEGFYHISDKTLKRWAKAHRKYVRSQEEMRMIYERGYGAGF